MTTADLAAWPATTISQPNFNQLSHRKDSLFNSCDRIGEQRRKDYHASICQTISYRSSHRGRSGFQRRWRRSDGRWQRPGCLHRHYQRRTAIPTTTALSPTTTALSPTTTALEEAPSKRTPAIDSATFAGTAKEAMADVATKAAITAGTEKADHCARSWVYGRALLV